MRALSEEEQIKSYAKYYALDLFPPAFGLRKQITAGPLSEGNMISLKNRDQLLACSTDHAQIGYGHFPDGTGYIATLTCMPGVTSDMIDWWFAWHGLESARYVIWDKEDHYSVKTDHTDRLTNHAIPMKERIWGVTHRVLEDTGCGPEEITIHFQKPSDFFDEDALKDSPIETMIWANGSSAVMCHTVFANPEGQGVILSTHFWPGWNLIDKQPVKILPDNIQIPEAALRGLALHSIKEYANLGRFLPYLYAEEEQHRKVLLQPVIL